MTPAATAQEDEFSGISDRRQKRRKHFRQINAFETITQPFKST